MSELDPIELQVMLGALAAACDEMGVVLVRSAHSANIKERRDASTALFDARGQMVMQAEHIPVHLGAMPTAVAAVLDEEHAPGDAWILNDPYAGGTHLPDITAVSPVFHDDELIGFAASRAHHADVGAPEPGSMPSDSRSLEDEGVVIPPTRLARGGELDRALLGDVTSRMRNAGQREADLRAQLAANRTGSERLGVLAERHGLDTLRRAMDQTQDYAERRTRARIDELEDGERTATDVLEAREGDLELCLRATVAGDAIELDFTGSADQHDGNLNCPLAVTLSACYFALRVLADPDVPPCAGAYRPLTVIAPEGSLLNARSPAAVAAGNVETSSRVADLVLAAFGHALGQGTMNNLTLGNDSFTYYETLGGGQGACADADGPTGVHVAMSNTLNTPIEALELEFPLRAIEYAIRRGSGGAGEHHGGDGVAREVEALEEMRYSLITERRRHAPPGATGGEPGARGANMLNGEELAAKASGTLHPATGCESRPPEVADMADSESAAFIGLGIMGAPMAANLARAGIEVVAYNRTREKAEALAREFDNVTVADSPAAAASAAGVAISMVPDVPEVEEMLLGPEGAAEGLPDGGLAIDMSTIAPSASRSIGGRLADRGIGFLDAPVTGSRPKAEDGTLTIMVGGAESDFDRAAPLFAAMGELVLHMGPQGHGSLVKLINNTLAAVNASALAEGISLGRAGGLDLEKAMQVVGSGSGESKMRELKAEPMIAGDYEPLFKLEHMLKDVRYFLAEAQALGVGADVASTAAGLYTQAEGNGLGGDDFSAVIEAIGTKSGLK